MYPGHMARQLCSWLLDITLLLHGLLNKVTVIYLSVLL